MSGTTAARRIGFTPTPAGCFHNEEYQAHIQEIEAANPHDRQEITSNDGVLSVNWEDVLAVFSAKVTGAEDGSQVASLDDAQVDELRSIMWEMNAISYTTRTESSSVEVTSTDENGNEVTSTETVTETILEITITHKTPEEMAQQYSFNDRQNEYLALMTEPENENLWAELLGGYVSGGGQIIDPNTNWERTGIFQWPLPQSYTITSWFGYRVDPFTGEIDYRGGFSYVPHPTVSAIQYYLGIHYDKKFYLKDLASHFFLTETYLCDLFKKNTGETVVNFLNRVRVNNACWLLQKTDLSIKEVAAQVGFPDYSYFGRIFRKSTGVTPDSYRSKPAD